MAKTYYGLTWWQSGVVIVWAIVNAASVATGTAEFLGAIVGGGIVLYLLVRLTAMASRSLRTKFGRRTPAEN